MHIIETVDKEDGYKESVQDVRENFRQIEMVLSVVFLREEWKTLMLLTYSLIISCNIMK